MTPDDELRQRRAEFYRAKGLRDDGTRRIASNACPCGCSHGRRVIEDCRCAYCIQTGNQWDLDRIRKRAGL